jgi:beta-lactamase class D
MSLSEDQCKKYEKCLKISEAAEQQDILKKLIPGSLPFYEHILIMRLRSTQIKQIVQEKKFWE